MASDYRVVTMPEPAEAGPAAPFPKLRSRSRLPRKLRNIELVLLGFALVINGTAIVLVQLGVGIDVDTSMLTIGAVPALLSVVLHFALRFTAPDADPFILPIGTVLGGLGVAMIYRLDLAEGYTGWAMYSVRQLVWTAIAIGIAIVVIVVLRNHRVLQRFTYLAMFVGIVLLLLPMIPGLGVEVNGASLWIDLGFFSFQPGEIAKIALAVFFAGYLVTRRDTLSMVGPTVLGVKLPRMRDLGPIVVIWIVAMAVLVLQRDLGTSLLYFGLFLVMLYVATGRPSWLIIGLLLFAGGAFLASQVFGYVGARISGWIHAFDPEVYDQIGGSYQLVQGIFGLGAGELIGTGLGQGRPDIVPLAESDFIIPSLGEELGLAGLFAILCLYLLLISRGFRIGFAGQDDFGKLLSVGLSFVLALQCFIVIGGVTRVIPLTGLTTPLLSAGGSALVANWVILAILLRTSDTVRNQPKLVV